MDSTYNYIYLPLEVTLGQVFTQLFTDFQKCIYAGNIYHAIDPATGMDEYGYEKEPHITVFYGLKDDAYQPIRNFIQSNFSSIDFELQLISFFRRDDKPYDVMKIDVWSDALQEIHSYIKNNFRNDWEYPEYQPHVTLAYVKKGTLGEWEGQDLVLSDMLFQAKDLIYQTKDNQKLSLL